jgi:hypothetical protein
MFFIKNLLGKWTYKKINKGLLPNDATTSTHKKSQLELELKCEHIVATLDESPSKKGTMDSLPHGYSFVVGNSNAQVFLQLLSLVW